MILDTDTAIADLTDRLIARTLPKSDWTHAAHFAAALWLLCHRPALAAPDAMRTLIMRYNEATNTPNTDSGGYHHTITIASLRAAADCLARHAPEAPLHDVLRVLMASPLGRSDWLLEYWTRETLFSVAARRDWVAPDRADLDFG